MEQIHKRFTGEQVRALLKGYHQGALDRAAIEEILGISKSTFFVLLREYRQNPDEFSLTYQRATPTRLPASAEKEIEAELMLEKGLDSVWRKHVLQTDEADPQWRQVMNVLGVEAIFALSPQAKGKIERPYRWLQDRIVRTCAIEKLTTIEEARAVLKDELDRYNNHQVHSTTGEVPSIRFEKARKEGNSLFRPFALPKPYTSAKDVFCLRETRTVNGYRRISLFNHEIAVPNVPLREEVEVHLLPDTGRDALEVRIWWDNRMVHSVAYPLNQFPRVHF